MFLEIAQNSQENTFFTEHLWTAASGSIEINLEDFLQMIIQISCKEVLLKIKLLLQKMPPTKYMYVVVTAYHNEARVEIETDCLLQTASKVTNH